MATEILDSARGAAYTKTTIRHAIKYYPSQSTGEVRRKHEY